MPFSKRALSLIAGAVVLAFSHAVPAAAQNARAQPVDWGGFQVGAYAGFSGTGLAGVRVGYNIARDRFVFGVDAGVGVATIIGLVEARARVGALVRPNVLAYASAGVLYLPAVGFVVGAFGGGVEYAFAPDLSVYGEVAGIRFFGGPPFWQLLPRIGVSWRPGR